MHALAGAGLGDLDWYVAGDEYVVTDELGIPLHPETYPDEFTRVKRAGLPKIPLHDSRHTTLSLMEKAGVPISIISKWAGHYDSSFTMKTYVQEARFFETPQDHLLNRSDIRPAQTMVIRQEH
jgi:integrase